MLIEDGPSMLVLPRLISCDNQQKLDKLYRQRLCRDDWQQRKLLGFDVSEECDEGDDGIHIQGDDNSTVENHYHNVETVPPAPVAPVPPAQPQPPNNELPGWVPPVLSALIAGFIALLVLLAVKPGDGTEPPIEVERGEIRFGLEVEPGGALNPVGIDG